jgi:hypothetical protein
MDRDTRFLIASKLTQTRREHEATNLFLEGQRTTGIVPNILVTDGLESYRSAFNQTFAKKKTIHVRSPRFVDKTQNNLIERFHGTVRERTKVMRGLDDSKSANSVVEGMKINYNFVRPHSALNGKTPAEAAGLPSFGNGNRWKAFIEQSVEAKERKETPAQTWNRQVLEGITKKYLKGESNGVNTKWVLRQIEYLKQKGLTDRELRNILSQFNNPTLMVFMH